MPTKQQLKRMKAKEKREQKKQEIMQGTHEPNNLPQNQPIQMGSSLSSAGRAAAPSLDKISDSVDSKVAKDKNANCSSAGTASVENPAAQILDKNAESAFIKTAPIEESSAPKPADKITESLKQLALNNNKFMHNFNPETSDRERRKNKIRRKNNRKIQKTQNPTPVKRPPAARLYDEYGIYIASGQDICDCLFPNCAGCFYECPKCNSIKCGMECRVNRTFVYDKVFFEGISFSLNFHDIVK